MAAAKRSDGSFLLERAIRHLDVETGFHLPQTIGRRLKPRDLQPASAARTDPCHQSRSPRWPSSQHVARHNSLRGARFSKWKRPNHENSQSHSIVSRMVSRRWRVSQLCSRTPPQFAFIAIAGGDGRVTFLNDAGCALVGVSLGVDVTTTAMADYHLAGNRPPDAAVTEWTRQQKARGTAAPCATGATARSPYRYLHDLPRSSTRPVVKP